MWLIAVSLSCILFYYFAFTLYQKIFLATIFAAIFHNHILFFSFLLLKYLKVIPEREHPLLVKGPKESKNVVIIGAG